MKSKATISILLLSLLAGAAYAQQPVPAEKKRALHKFDPLDIFPEAREERRSQRAGGDAQPAPDAPANRATDERRSARRERRHRNTSLAARFTPTPALIAAANPAPTPALAPLPAPSPKTETVVTLTQPSPASAAQSLAAPARGTGLSLPLVLTLFAVLLLALIVVFVKLTKQLRSRTN